MAMQPGPRQVFPSNITRVAFPTIGGLLFLRAEQRFSGDPAFAEPAPKAFVYGLPASWGDFDMFALQVGKVDDKSKLGLISITDPVTPKMLDKYLYWPHKPPAHVVGTKTITPPDSGPGILVLDKANWSPIINHEVVFMITTLKTRAEGIAEFIDIFTNDLHFIPSLFSAEDVGVTVIKNTGQELTQDEIIREAPLNGWEYHFESDPSPPATVKGVTDVAIVILNLAKLFRDAPLVNNKKPTKYKFFIRAAANPYGANVSFTWGIGASAWIPKNSNPPKAKERLTFPVEDGTGTYLSPTFPHPDEPNASQGGGGSDVEDEFAITVTFGVAGVAPKVTIELASGGS